MFEGSTPALRGRLLSPGSNQQVAAARPSDLNAEEEAEIVICAALRGGET